MECVELFGLCFRPMKGTATVFGFKDFIAALALLVIIFTLSDIRYRFRVAVAPIPLFNITFGLITFIGVGTLLNDIWLSEQWLVPVGPLTTGIWQGILAGLFLALAITWMYYAFIKPPTFGRRNFKKYWQELYRIVLKGSEDELPVIAHELAASAKSMVRLAADLPKVQQQAVKVPTAEGYAHDMLLLLANRKFCRALVASSPITAIRFLDVVTETKAYHVPIGLFAQNVSTEAIRNKDSGLYHEDEGYRSGLLGYMKPLSQALYGNYALIDRLQHHSPLDVDYTARWSWDADQFKTYCRAVLMTFKSFVDGDYWHSMPFALNRAIGEIQEITSRAISDINKAGEDWFGDAWHRLSTGVDFFKEAVTMIGKMQEVPEARTFRIRDPDHSKLRDEDLYDRLAEAMSDIIFSAAHVEGPPEKAWSIHHNSVWSDFFERADRENHAWKIVQFKLRRLLYDEIRRLETMPIYKSAAILGICLNVMGLTPGKRSGYGKERAALKAAVLAWTRRHYLTLRQRNREIADECLIGGITFDAEQGRLVKTYAKWVGHEPEREHLQLDPPS